MSSDIKLALTKIALSVSVFFSITVAAILIKTIYGKIFKRTGMTICQSKSINGVVE